MEILSEILTIGGISINAFLITLFISSILKNKTNILLILLLIAFIPLFLSYNLTIINNEEWLFSMLPFTSISLIIIGPLLYEYAFHFFNANNKKLFKQKKKYIPFIISILLLSSSYALLSQETYLILLTTITAFSFLYLLYFVIILIKYQLKSANKLKYFYANVTDKNLHWVNILILGLFIVLILDSISGIIILVTEFRAIHIINSLFLVILIWYLGFYSLTQEKLTENIHEYKIPVKTNIENNLCATEEFQKLKDSLNIAMGKDKLYKLEKINLSILSKHLGTSVKKTSYLLNQCMDTTFYDLINKLRLEEFKSKVTNGELTEKTILALAFESGFNSKATFNRIFKQKEKISPVQFVKSQNNVIK